MLQDFGSNMPAPLEPFWGQVWSKWALRHAEVRKKHHPNIIFVRRSQADIEGKHSGIFIWLVVWNMAGLWLSMYGEESSQLTKSYFSEGLKPPTRCIFMYLHDLCTPWFLCRLGLVSAWNFEDVARRLEALRSCQAFCLLWICRFFDRSFFWRFRGRW